MYKNRLFNQKTIFMPKIIYLGTQLTFFTELFDQQALD
jgi:hypothetical protein